MRIRTTLFIAVVGIAGFASVARTFSADPPASSTKRSDKAAEEQSVKDANKWMEIKLHASQEIFAALSRGDAKAIETPARRMLLIARDHVARAHGAAGSFAAQAVAIAQLGCPGDAARVAKAKMGLER